MDLSNEQTDIILKLKNNNITINAIAGSGKTSTICECVNHYQNLSFLIITYNKALQLETKSKLIYCNNAEVHTYHSLCTKYYNPDANTDFYLVNSYQLPILENKQFDVLILDEAQDIKIIYYEFISKIIEDMKIDRMCLFGDYKQNIYAKLGSTNNYLLDPTLFKFQINNWIKLTLSTSFRCSNKIANLINNLMHENYLKSNNDKCELELMYYKITNDISKYKKLEFLETKIIELIGQGYNYDQIMILFPSFKYRDVKIFINSLQETIGYINIIALTNINIDARSNLLLKNKIIISSIHSSKGLERDVVIMLPFNESFNDITHNKDRFNCSNLLYVALTRAKKKLILYKHINVINKKKLIIPLLIQNSEQELFDNIKYTDEIKFEEINNNSIFINNIINDVKSLKDKENSEIITHINNKYDNYMLKLEKYFLPSKKKANSFFKVKEYLNFKPIEYYLFYQDKFNIVNVFTGTSFNIQKEIQNKERNIYEDVSSLIGLIIPMYIELLLTKQVSLLKYIKGYNLIFSEKQLKNQINILQKLTITYCIDKEKMFTYKKYQVPSDIIPPEIFIKIVKFGYNYINELNSDNDYELLFETNVAYNKLRGSIDLLMKYKNKDNKKKDIIIEFKLTSINDISNYLQIFIYAILYCETYKKNINDIKLLYINLSISSVYLLDFSTFYDEIKQYIFDDIDGNSICTEEDKQNIITVNDYINYIKKG
jgi:hypothetical protein